MDGDVWIPAHSVLGLWRGPSSSGQTATFSWCPHVAEGARVPFYKASVPFLMLQSHNLITA